MDAHYSRYDGRQDPLADGLDVGEVLEQLGDDLLAGLSGRGALERLRQRGLPGRAGLDELRRRIDALRSRRQRSAPVDGPLEDLRAALQEVVDLEREALSGRDDEDARWAELELDALPDDLADRFQALRDRELTSPEAQAALDRIVEDLRRQVADAYLGELTRSMAQVTPQDIEAFTRMLADLNDLLDARARGEDPDVAGFLAEHGHLFPEGPTTLDEILELLARRAAAMSRVLASMTPEQRDELRRLAAEVLDDLDLDFQMARLGDHLREALPQMDWDRPLEDGGDPVEGGLAGLVDHASELSELDALEEALAGEYAGASLDDVDEEALRRHLGDDAVRDLRALRRIEEELERAGALRRRAGNLELTPRGARLLGQRALTRMLQRVRRAPSTRVVGADPEPTGQTRPWAFGDREPIDVGRTLTNAVLRDAATGGRSGGRAVRLQPEDFAVAEQEVRPRTATALLLDLSFSMPLQGHLVPAKRLALALHALIAGEHRQDSLHLIGFSDYARRLQPADLADVGYERVYGTNMQHAFLLARRLLLDDPRPVKQVVMITDGEPTAHLEDGLARFHWPPVPETVESTLREAMRLARSGISLDVFLLEDAPGLVAFSTRLADLTGGAVHRAGGEELSEAVLRGYRAG